jgi:hypothetical protein
MNETSTYGSKAKSKGERKNPNEQFPDTEAGWASRWSAEFVIAERELDKWLKQGKKVIHRFLDDKRGEIETVGDLQSNLNLFHSNTIQLQSMLYGRLPKVEVDRTFADANDDEARVAALILSRILNQDIQAAGEDYASVLRSCLQDRLLPGLGSARVKYDYKSEITDVPPILDPVTGEEMAEGYEDEKVTDEWVDTIYTHWTDQLWSPARTYGELRWKAYRSFMNYDELCKRFGDEVAKNLPKTSKVPGRDSKKEDSVEPQTEVWEIWDKTRTKVFWFVKGYDKILDSMDDPLELEGFWPDPPPMIANVTTTKYIPRSDYVLAQDLYNEIDKLQTRISILTDACKSIGFYDKNNAGIKRAMQEGVENDLIPVDNWAMYAEKGGAKGVVDWMPIETVARTIEILTSKQGEKIQQLYQITGMSDIMRGASQPYEAAATSKAKVEFASIRVQALQDDFARFASELQSLKVQIIQNFYEPYCIKEQSNIMFTEDGKDEMLVDRAIALIKDKKRIKWRITIRPESLALADYAKLKADRTEYINALSMFMQSAAPLVQLDKKITPILLELLKWGLAGFKGSNEIEGVLDKAIALYQKISEQPDNKPDPEQMKAQAEMQAMQAKQQAEMQKLQGEMQMAREEHAAKMQQSQMKAQQEMAAQQQQFQMELTKMRAEIQQDQQRFQLELKQMMMEFGMKKQELAVEVEAKRAEQQDQFTFNTAEREHEAEVRLQSDNKGNGGGNS